MSEPKMSAKGVLGLVLVCVGILATLSNLARFAYLLLSVNYWTIGYRPQPVLDTLAGLSLLLAGALLAFVTFGLIASVVRGRRIPPRGAGTAALMIIGSAIVVAASAAVFLVNINEVHVTDGGFSDERYRITSAGDFGLYNGTGAPITVCLGTASQCDPAAKEPPELLSPGLTLLPGELRELVLGAGEQHLTIVAPATSMTRIDTTVVVDEPPSDGGADLPGY